MSLSTRFRQRKISVKQTLAVLWQRDLPDLDDEQQRELQEIETGVEKGEEDEHHLQQVINAHFAATAGVKVEQVYIPTPDASKVWPEYHKYYQGKFVSPATYIRGSATVEDTSGIAYCMDEEDEEFLKKLNEGKSGDKSENKSEDDLCTEDEFELVMDKFENYVSSKQPFLNMDLSQLASLNEMSVVIIKQIKDGETDPTSPEFLLAKIHNKDNSIYAPIRKPINSKGRSSLQTFQKFSADIYPHWKERKLARAGKSIIPSVKFEDVNASEKENDSDPYICFRRREVRQVRKTRRTDQQSSERLRKLQAEMEAARKLMSMVVKREELRKEALQAEWDVFEKRCRVKAIKRQLGIRGDDEDLVNHKKKKPNPEEVAAAAAVTNAKNQALSNLNGSESALGTAGNASGIGIGINNGVAGKDDPNSIIPPNVRLAASKIPDLEVLTLEQVLQEKEHVIRAAVKGKLKQRAQNDKDWVNYTDNPFVPYCDYFDDDLRGYTRTVDGRHAAYSSIVSPYPPSLNVALKLPLASSLGSSYASRVEVPPMIMHTHLNAETGDLELMSKTKEKELTSSIFVQRNTSVSLRKRYGRGGRLLVDRRGLMRGFDSRDGGVSEKLKDRYKYDNEDSSDVMSFSPNHPSALNKISEDTQSIRFGSMLLSKAYETYREAVQQRQQHLMNIQKLAQQQLQAQQQAAQQAAAQQAAAAAAASAQSQREGSQGPGQNNSGSASSTPDSRKIKQPTALKKTVASH